MKFNKEKLTKIKGDASFRIFYRKKNKRKTSIVVYAKKEKKKNLLIYDSVNKLLLKNKIFAPKLFNENYKNNFIEIEDFGKETVFDLLKKNYDKIDLYKKSIDLLNRIQKIKKNKTRTFTNKIYKLPVYNNKKLSSETKLFINWYAKKFLSKKKLQKLDILLNKQIKFLLSNIRLKNNVFVHRDFHVSNLMKYKSQIALIDTQDAVIGNQAYDLASLIDDVRFKSNKNFKDKVYEYYLKSNKCYFNKNYFLNDFEILSVLRNMKIIGIFTRLAERDKKNIYLNLIPYTWKLIELRMKKNQKFNELKKIFNIYFPKKMRNFR
jgi:N-acetylmuramate 1-kinase